MPTLTRNGVTLYYEVHGSGPTLLLRHGFSATSAMWQSQITALSATHRLVLWDMRGHGRSDYPDDPTQYSAAATVADMAAILDAVGAKTAIIGGLSLGGYMSLAFYRAHPERTEALLIIDTGPGFKKDDAREAWNARALGTAAKLEAEGLATLKSASAERAGSRHRNAQGLAYAARGMLTQQNADVIESLPNIAVPSLVLVGGRDTPFLAASDYMAAKIPNASKIVIPDAGHAANIDQPAAFNEAVTSFLATLKQDHPMTVYADIATELTDHVGLIEIRKPPHNFFDVALINQIADALAEFDTMPACRAIVLAAQGKAFCAGADFANRPDTGTVSETEGVVVKHLYKEAIRIFRSKKPIVAAVHGPAIGGGLGLALVADFRVTCAEARFSANFNRLGFHPGFGLTTTLPRLVGPQKAALLFYTGRRIGGEEAVAIGMADLLVPEAEVRSAAMALATEIAQSAPLSTQSTRETLRRGLADAIEAATERELVEQDWQRKTADFKEGVKAMAERRLPNFQNR